MPHAVQSNSALPSRKSRNSGLWFRRQRLRRPPAKASRNSLRVWVTPRKCSWSGAFSYAYAGEIIISSTCSSSLRKSSTSRTVLGGSCVTQDVIGVLDLAAARAREVALEQRLELHEQRELRAFGQTLAHQVPAHVRALPDRYRHRAYLSLPAPSRARRRRPRAAEPARPWAR